MSNLIDNFVLSDNVLINNSFSDNVNTSRLPSYGNLNSEVSRIGVAVISSNGSDSSPSPSFCNNLPPPRWNELDSEVSSYQVDVNHSSLRFEDEEEVSDVNPIPRHLNSPGRLIIISPTVQNGDQSSPENVSLDNLSLEPETPELFGPFVTADNSPLVDDSPRIRPVRRYSQDI